MDFEGAFFNTNDYELTGKELGKGSFGKVYLAKKLSDDTHYAIKILNTENGFNGEDQMIFMRESLILHKLHHPSIVKFIGINFQSFDNSEKLEPSIITEYMSRGSLKELLAKDRRSILEFEWNSTKKYIILLGISNAMRYLHKNGILHRDLKPENILIDDDFYPHICDFGLSKCFPDSLTKTMQLSLTGKIGTPLYMAPELFADDEDDDDIQYGAAIDVYAFGMLAYEIVTGKEPFYELGKITVFKLVNKIISGYRPKLPESVPEKMKALILKCLSKNIEDRPSFEEIVNELSNDFSYFFKDVDRIEITKYIEIVSDEESKEINQKKTKSYHKQKGKNEVPYIKSIKTEKISIERKGYLDIIKELTTKVGDLQGIVINKIFLIIFNGTILHAACELGNTELVKHLISLNKVDIKSKDTIQKNIQFILF